MKEVRVMTAKAYVLIECVSGQAQNVAKSMRSKTGVLAADVITGPYDVIANIQAGDTEALSRMVLIDISGAPYVYRTTTCLVVSND